jgi:hypothetical protein
MSDNWNILADNDWQVWHDELGVIRPVYSDASEDKEIGLSMDVRLDDERITFVWYGSHDYRDGVCVEGEKISTQDVALLLTVLKVIISGDRVMQDV